METEFKSKPFEIELNQAQYKALSHLLPKGYKLEFINKSEHNDITPKITKKILTNEGTAMPINKKNKNDDNASNADTLSITQRRLRNSKGKRHLETKYGDFDALSNSSTKGIKQTSEGVKKCYNMLQKLKKHICAGPFLEPVDAVGLGIPDYYQIITEPMDLSTVERNLKNGVYTTTLQFGNDIRKIWNNSFRYNARGSDIYNMTSEMSSYFEKLFKEIENVSLNENIHDLQKKFDRLSKSLKELHSKGGAPKSTQSGTKSTKNLAIFEKPMTIYEKRALGQNIRNLPPEYLRGVWEIVSEGLPHSQSHKEELEFDIDTLPVKVTRELEKYVKSKLAQINKNQIKKKKAESLNMNQINHPNSLTPSKKKAIQEFPMDSLPRVEHLPHLQQQQVPQMKPMQNMMSNFEMPINSVQPNDDIESKSSESSFITDSSPSGSEDEVKKPKKKQDIGDIYHRQQDLSNFQAGGHGSMMNSFIIK